jgi:hypothetical protein
MIQQPEIVMIQAMKENAIQGTASLSTLGPAATDSYQDVD